MKLVKRSSFATWSKRLQGKDPKSEHYEAVGDEGEDREFKNRKWLLDERRNETAFDVSEDKEYETKSHENKPYHEPRDDSLAEAETGNRAHLHQATQILERMTTLIEQNQKEMQEWESAEDEETYCFLFSEDSSYGLVETKQNAKNDTVLEMHNASYESVEDKNPTITFRGVREQLLRENVASTVDELQEPHNVDETRSHVQVEHTFTRSHADQEEREEEEEEEGDDDDDDGLGVPDEDEATSFSNDADDTIMQAIEDESQIPSQHMAGQVDHHQELNFSSRHDESHQILKEDIKTSSTEEEVPQSYMQEDSQPPADSAEQQFEQPKKHVEFGATIATRPAHEVNEVYKHTHESNSLLFRRKDSVSSADDSESESEDSESEETVSSSVSESQDADNEAQKDTRATEERHLVLDQSREHSTSPTRFEDHAQYSVFTFNTMIKEAGTTQEIDNNEHSNDKEECTSTEQQRNAIELKIKEKTVTEEASQGCNEQHECNAFEDEGAARSFVDENDQRRPFDNGDEQQLDATVPNRAKTEGPGSQEVANAGDKDTAFSRNPTNANVQSSQAVGKANEETAVHLFEQMARNETAEKVRRFSKPKITSWARMKRLKNHERNNVYEGNSKPTDAEVPVEATTSRELQDQTRVTKAAPEQDDLTLRKMTTKTRGLGRVKLRSKRKNALTGIGEVISSTRIKASSRPLLPIATARKKPTGNKLLPKNELTASKRSVKVSKSRLLRSEQSGMSDMIWWSPEKEAVEIIAVKSNEFAEAWNEQEERNEQERKKQERKSQEGNAQESAQPPASNHGGANLEDRNDEKARRRERKRLKRGKKMRKKSKRRAKAMTTVFSDDSDVTEQCACNEAIEDGQMMCNTLADDYEGEADTGCRVITYELRDMAKEFIRQGPTAVVRWLN